MTTEANNALLIGYGNECCGDDALGPTVVRLIDAMGLPDVNVRAVHQLMPELADLLASAGQAIFVDATRVPQPSPIVIQRLHASSETAILTHSCHPSALLALAQLLYGQSPPGWLVTIEGRQFNLGDAVSAQARRHADSAAQMIARWLQNSGGKLDDLQLTQ